MKAITLHQGWASMIPLRAKQIETRSWYTVYRGQLAIHAAAHEPGWVKALWQEWPLRDILRQYDLRFDELPRGAIVAVCRLDDIIPTELAVSDGLSVREHDLGDYAPGRYAWKLSNVRALLKPVPIRGHQGVWNLPDELLAGVEYV